MAKITYLLGAGASYNACPILEKQAEMMIYVASKEINRLGLDLDKNKYKIDYDFKDKMYLEHSENSEFKILWYMGYFGEMAKEYNTVDTYARKLFLNNEKHEYRLLKMCVSIFFDLWENFYQKQYNENYHKIDNRYKALFSVLLDTDGNKISLNNDFKFITWNYDLQLEEAFKLFLGNNFNIDLNTINSNYLKFKKEIYSTCNDIFHLNGHRGFFRNVIANSEEEYPLNVNGNLDDYWKKLHNLYKLITLGNAKFDTYINYAWEHYDLDNFFFKKISEVINETDVLVIIGYSFPAFNRKIDQYLFNQLPYDKIKKIIYQDPNASKQIILNLFKNPQNYKDKIEILSDENDLKQFYLPNEYFITQSLEMSFTGL